MEDFHLHDTRAPSEGIKTSIKNVAPEYGEAAGAFTCMLTFKPSSHCTGADLVMGKDCREAQYAPCESKHSGFMVK